MDTLGALLARSADDGGTAIHVGGDPSVEYAREEFVTTAWKTANYFRGRGVHEGSTVAVVDDRAVAAVLSLFGAAQLGAVTRFVDRPVGDGKHGELDARLLVGPGESVLAYDLPPGSTRIAYARGTSDVDDPAVERFGRSVWSENPIEPPESVDPGAAALAFDGGTASHADLLRTAEDAAADLAAGDEVVVTASLTRPGTVVAGIVAPLLAGATIVFDDVDGEAALVVDEAACERWGSAIRQ